MTAEPLELAHAILALHLLEMGEQGMQIAIRQFTVGLPFHGTWFGTASGSGQTSG